MRVAVFSDVHGNLSGLKAVLDHIETQPKVDRVVFAGDACLFGPRPLQCVNELRNRNINCLVGNTDAWILQPPALDDGLDDSIRQKRVEIGEFCNWTLEKIDVTLYMNEEEVASLAFPSRTGEFDYLGFTSTDEKVLEWCKDLHSYYWDFGGPRRARANAKTSF